MACQRSRSLLFPILFILVLVTADLESPTDPPPSVIPLKLTAEYSDTNLTQGITVAVFIDRSESDTAYICLEVKPESGDVTPHPDKELIATKNQLKMITKTITFESSSTQIADKSIPVEISTFLPTSTNNCIADQVVSTTVELTDDRGTYRSVLRLTITLDILSKNGEIF